MASVTLSLILEKVASRDKDFRYMATSDLANELAKESFRFDSPTTEKQVSDVVLQQLEDASGDISGLAVKCLGHLVNKNRDEQLGEVVGALCTKMLSGTKEQLRDVASLGLKTVVAELSSKRAGVLVGTATPRLIEGLKAEASDIVSSSLDILAELTARYGASLPDPEGLKKALLPELDESRAGVRKRAIQCLASLAAALPPPSLSELCTTVLDRLDAKGLKPDTARTYVQALGAISKAVGHKFGPHLPRSVPLCIRYLRSAAEGDEELREYCLQALESFVLRSPQEARAQLGDILPVCLEFLRFDPNYAAADEMGDDEEADDMEAEEDEDASEEEWSDDEDTSWKVRRAAAKAVSAVITHFPDLLTEVYPKVAPTLAARFREREETVKQDVFQAYVDLLRQVGLAARRSDGAATGLLRADIPAVMRAVAKQLRHKSAKTKVGVFRVLLELVAVTPDAVGGHAGELLPGIQAALRDPSSAGASSKIQALQFLNSAMSANSPATFQPSAAALSKPVFEAVGERYYKVAAEALRVCEQLVRVVRPDVGAPMDASLQPLVKPLYECVMARLSAQDQDQEVKECAISCMAAAVASLGDVLGADVAQVLRVLLDRLRNEITRTAAVRALATIARSPLNIDLSSVLAPALAELTSFLRKANRQLRQASLSALDAIVTKDGSRVEDAVLMLALEEAAALVNEGDLLVTALSLGFATTALREQPTCAATVCDKVLPQAIALVKSPLLQGSALEALQAFFHALVSSGAKGASADQLLGHLTVAGTEPDASRSAQHAAAQCFAVLSAASGQGGVNATVERLLRVLQDPKQDDTHKRFALLCIGELGRRADFSAFPTLPDLLTAALGSELIAESASTALGGVAAGNLGAYLPLLLRHVHAQAGNPKQLYQLLKALNEVITSIAHGAAQSGVGAAMSDAQQAEVLQLLLSAAGESEEECRAVVAECLGSLALLNGKLVLPTLRSQLGSPSAETRTAVVAAVRHCLVDPPHPIDSLLAEAMPDFLERMGDDDRHVRRAAVQALSTGAHTKPGLVADHLGGVLPLLYQQTVVNTALIRIVDLGPFKHQIDDGLELRKSAFECMDELLDRCYDRLDATAFIAHLEGGLKDHYDVKTICHPILTKLAAIAPGQVTSALDRLVEPLAGTLQAKVKADAVKQEIDRNEDMLRSCLRAVDALAKLPNAAQVAPFKQFMDSVVLGPTLKEKYIAIKEERRELEGADGMDISYLRSSLFGDPERAAALFPDCRIPGTTEQEEYSGADAANCLCRGPPPEWGGDADWGLGARWCGWQAGTEWRFAAARTADDGLEVVRSEQPVRLSVCSKPFADGSVSHAFHCRDDAGGRWVLKRPLWQPAALCGARQQQRLAALTTDAETAAICHSAAQAFTQTLLAACEAAADVAYLPASVVVLEPLPEEGSGPGGGSAGSASGDNHVAPRGGQPPAAEAYLKEPWLECGANCQWVKWTRNDGKILGDGRGDEVMQAFTHFSLAFLRQALGIDAIILDAQGAVLEEGGRRRYVLSDPAICSVAPDADECSSPSRPSRPGSAGSSSSFGKTDLGRRAIAAFLAAHTCGAACRRCGCDGVRL
ncbi:cullin-associated NEDD8-dissociated 1 isoform B [Micractinium conductrix]|uniref:Cullin-associated NEDD8-dissociated 1 isoform B n=1 Tax=Micractinium conductrix TaxID=554055 RepID=A0A2P6VPQ7_9CHLO|nr:cullin-associated NEDD8-dissociated 1 isoform B [Micractinium conductrix]|eukprot:PSC76088.1 cullin-associated NEDD8-dissociated 1 isoform B [Micractinium conductrix]